MPDDLAAGRAGDERAFARLIAPHRRELLAHCYRLSASLHDAEDLLQESLLRAWRGLGAFEGRSSMRTWLYKVTTNVCLDGLRDRGAPTLPTELGPAADPSVPMAAPRLDPVWLEPFPEALYHEASAASPQARHGEPESGPPAVPVARQLL